VQQLARGTDDRPVVADHEAKSISAETTFAEDTGDQEFLHRVLLELADDVAERLRKAQRMARTVSLKLRFADFRTISRDTTLPEATTAGIVMYEHARRLLERANPRKRKVRLIGIGVSNLTDERQLWLFDEAPLRAERTEQAIDELRDRFGRNAVRRATLLRERPRAPGDPG